MPTQLDNRQVVQRAVLPMVGNAANETLDVLFPRIDAEMAKLFEDRNILLTDGGTITFTGTQVQFSESLKITLNQKISGAVPQVIDLGSASQNFTNNGDMFVAVINRTAGTATTSIVTAGNALPAVNATNQEVFLLAKRVDAGDGTQRLYWRNGSAFNAGQTARLGSAGSGGSGSGIGDDLNALLFRASFTDLFAENAANANSSISTAFGTNAVFNAAKSMYTMSYDASKTVSTTGTAVTVSSAPTFTVAIGDVIVANNVVRKITAVASQTSYTIEAAFPTNLASAAATISQAVYTKDIYNLAVDGAALSAAFAGATFSEILVDYKDNATTGSNLFTPNTTPFVGFAASNDNTNFTTVGLRNTNETDIENSVTLPSAGTSLYVRFFASRSSGSGVVNLIMYKAFMQKTTQGTSGGITNSAYAFTNGVGTPVNCTVSLAGGKTVVTFNWSYALGVYAGTSASSIEVWLNGQKIPRFINSTLTPDASFLESSATSITLDRDYSQMNLSVEVFQRTQIVDNSTTNTTAITYQQEIMQQGFQGFVNMNALMNATTTTGAPVSGSFYSAIVNRASIPDLSQDLKARMGIERHQLQSLAMIQNEFGATGETVWADANDPFNRVRFVGDWQSATGTDGTRLFSGANTTDYIEIVFYGTGLNLLGTRKDNRSVAISIDGGAETTVSNIWGTSAPMSVRNYVENAPANVASNLSLGVHTVRIRGTVSSAVQISGYESLNESGLIRINPGISYLNGKKAILNSQASFAYNAPVTGSRGGRVLVYQNADGTIGSAFRATQSQAVLASADHSNEEVVRSYYWREFGAGRTDDFSRVIGSQNASFTLDDGVTTLNAVNVTQTVANGFDGFFTPATTDWFQFTFIGTGLDILVHETNTGTVDVYNVTIDGTVVGGLDTTAVTGRNAIKKVASGLTYGTHVVRFQRTSVSAGRGYSRFIVYQPKKPTLPSGAVELADYNVMADFAANATAGLENIATGVMRKSNTREFCESGTFVGVSLTPASFIGGWLLATNTSGGYIEYTFFGTGLEIRGRSETDRSTNISVTLNTLAATTANFSTLVSSVYGGWAFASGTLNQNAASTTGAGLRISGLPLAKYTIRLTTNTAAYVSVDSMDIITPIHSQKSNTTYEVENTLAIGSQGISDNRKSTPVKDVLPATKAVAQATGITSSPTTTSTSPVPCPDLFVTVKTGTSKLLISWTIGLTSSTVDGLLGRVYIDGVSFPIVAAIVNPGAGSNMQLAQTVIVPVQAGTHSVQVYWNLANGGGTLTGFLNHRTLDVVEL